MITIEQYLMGRTDFSSLPQECQDNLNSLLPKVNALLTAFGQNRAVTSGYRSKDDQIRIYNEINAKRTANGQTPIHTPMGSKHLVADAVDLEDHDGKLDEFCTDDVLTQFNLYREHPDYTIGWTHLQTLPPGSGSRTFKPY